MPLCSYLVPTRPMKHSQQIQRENTSITPNRNTANKFIRLKVFPFIHREFSPNNNFHNSIWCIKTWRITKINKKWFNTWENKTQKMKSFPLLRKNTKVPKRISMKEKWFKTWRDSIHTDWICLRTSLNSWLFNINSNLDLWINNNRKDKWLTEWDLKNWCTTNIEPKLWAKNTDTANLTSQPKSTRPKSIPNITVHTRRAIKTKNLSLNTILMFRRSRRQNLPQRSMEIRKLQKLKRNLKMIIWRMLKNKKKLKKMFNL